MMSAANMILKYGMTDTLLEQLAARVAVAANGGSWDTHYTKDQKRLWIERVRAWFL